MAREGGSRHALLLRGINVGGHHKVPMADLRAMLADLGYGNIRTLLNSGNAVFDVRGKIAHARLATTIETTLEERFGFRPKAFVLSAADLDTVVDENTLATTGDNPSRLMVVFFAGATDRDKVAPLAKRSWGNEALAVGTRAAYVWCPDSILESPAFDALSKALGAGATARNWATTLKVQAACRAR